MFLKYVLNIMFMFLKYILNIININEIIDSLVLLQISSIISLKKYVPKQQIKL